MRTCFIIMPVTTPDYKVSVYDQDKHHFQHVLEFLFIPSLEKAGLEPIPPIAKGADLIHAKIIRNIEKADLVLSDISCLNPNVFFELGIRTALNKPVCYVKDSETNVIPFDNSIINHHTYSSKLELWNIEQEIEKLSEHIKTTTQRNGEGNMLWKYFGLSSIGHQIETKGSPSEFLDVILMKIDSLSQKTKGVEVQQRELEIQKRHMAEVHNQFTKLSLEIYKLQEELKASKINETLTPEREAVIRAKLEILEKYYKDCNRDLHIAAAQIEDFEKSIKFLSVTKG